MAEAIIIGAPRSGSGKTLITLGLIAAIRRRGVRVAAAKIGPDYIDTAILGRAAGAPAINLDHWAMRHSRAEALATQHTSEADLLVIEGVIGLYDGAADGTGSTALYSQNTGLPVVLVVDAEKQAQSIAPLVWGFMTWGTPGPRICGVILNRVGSARHEKLLREALVPTEVRVLGAISRSQALHVPERHLGLVLPSELAEFDKTVEAVADLVSAHVDIYDLMGFALPLHPFEAAPALAPLGQHVAIARDAAFAFIYEHMLMDWRRSGATLSFFSPLANEAPAADADAVFLPGGYPELHGGALAAAENFKAGLVAVRDRGALIYGECGGYMVLGESLTDKQGTTHAMTSLLPVSTRIDKPKRTLGYRRLTHASALPWPGKLSGHEFHYSSGGGEGLTPLFEATDTLGEERHTMGAQVGRVMGSYAHVIDVAE